MGEQSLGSGPPGSPSSAGYRRLTAGDVLLPQGQRDFIVGEIACFRSPIVDERASTTAEMGMGIVGGEQTLPVL